MVCQRGLGFKAGPCSQGGQRLSFLGRPCVPGLFGALVPLRLAVLFSLLAAPAWAAVSPAPLPVTPAAAVDAPTDLSPSTQAEPLSPSAETEEPVLPEDADDPLALASQAALTDLKPLSSTTLAALAAALGPDQESVWLDPESGEAVDADASGAARVDAGALFAELALRLARHEDKDARAALGMAIMKKDARAKEAKDLAFEDKLADAVIAQLEAGAPKAKAELEALAAKGNRRARQYLQLDAPPPNAAGEPALSKGAAEAVTGGARVEGAQPQTLSSSAKP